MEKITKEVFLQRLQENKKEFSSEEDMLKYKLEILQYYLHNCKSPVYSMDMSQVVIDYNKIDIQLCTTPTCIQLTNHFFEELVERLEEFK